VPESPKAPAKRHLKLCDNLEETMIKKLINWFMQP
jgi:hypothetical protein